MDINDIKFSIEKIFKEQLNCEIKVEFVNNVSEKAHEITKIDEKVWNNTYEATHYTGTFIPYTQNHPSYILIEKGRELGLLIETSFHEQRHAIDYFLFLKQVFDNNQQKMIDSPLYVTFQIYSEFEATKYGLLNYLKLVDYPNLNKQEQKQNILNAYKKIYENTDNIKNKYQFLIHSIQYLGCLCAISEYDNNFDIEVEINQMDYAYELNNIFNLLYKNKDKKDRLFFEKFDKECRDYVG